MIEIIVTAGLCGIGTVILGAVMYKRGFDNGVRSEEKAGYEQLKRSSAGWVEEHKRIYSLLEKAGVDLVAVGLKLAVTDVRSCQYPLYNCVTPGAMFGTPESIVNGKEKDK